ncbi:MAG TPA: M28 family peptidase [Candidatus Eisenbacteria bacterium]|nr:M28 family peptidase [Candidatus Eisenbacteria bacterium]
MLERQCAFGPRVPGSAAHDSCFAWLVGRFRALAPVVETDTFTYDSPDLGRELRLMNLVARFRPKAKERILFGAHWDSRPWADKDPSPKLRTRPILGANDGASGVAVLLEVARVLQKTGTPIGVDLVLFDGEDLGTEENPNGFFLGSSRYVERLGEGRPLFVIVVDMVGKKDLNLSWEANSRAQASNVVDLVWQEARELGINNFRSTPGPKVFDDHVPFLNASIPAIDLIDFDFPEWHTTGDVPATCSPQSLEAVGAVLVSLATKASFLSR